MVVSDAVAGLNVLALEGGAHLPVLADDVCLLLTKPAAAAYCSQSSQFCSSSTQAAQEQLSLQAEQASWRLVPGLQGMCAVSFAAAHLILSVL